MDNFKSYILCTTPRSGSTLLCGLLAQLGTCGNPDSYVHSHMRADWLASHNLAEADFATPKDAVAAGLHAVQLAGKANTQTFGLRLQGGYLQFLLAQLEVLFGDTSSDAVRINATFGPTLYIHLMRDDRLAQAISHEIATQSGLWHRAADGSEMERLSAPRNPVFNRAAIAYQMKKAEQLDAQWQAWFVAQGIVPLIIRYSDLAADPASTLARVLHALGRDEEVAHDVSPKVSRLSGALNREWATRFLAHE